MKTQPSSKQRNRQTQFAPLKPVCLRLPSDLWEKCGWAAAAAGLDRSTYVRNALSYATRRIERPKSVRNHEILASEAEWTAWEALAKRYGLLTPDFVCQLLNRAVERAQRS